MKTLWEVFVTLIHPGPIATLVLIKTITLSVIYCSLMWWPPNESIGGMISLTSFLIFSGLTMYNFFTAILFGPGFLPSGWKPVDKEAFDKLQFCVICDGYKAPRAHHCRKCNRCVMKMDHHCPWINGCVGHRNQAHFIGFLLAAVIGCSEATVILSCSLYHALYRSYYVYYDIEDAPFVYLGMYGFLWVLFSLGCAFGVALGVGLLLYYQVKILWKNQTSIEDWIVEKAEHRRGRDPNLDPLVFPYNFGWKANFKLVFSTGCRPAGDGLSWPVLPGCDQYTLTVEQLQQKNQKRHRMKEFVAVEDFSGSWFPCSKGFGVFFHPPCSDESRMPLTKENRLLVTRWKKHWLYGEKLHDAGITDRTSRGKDRPKGWFPRRCAVEVIDSVMGDNDEHWTTCTKYEKKTTSSSLNSKKKT